jgi:glycosyltransferase involved in cell wall biosynthesis
MGDDDFETISKQKFGKLFLWLIRTARYNIVLSEDMLKINSRHFPRRKISKIYNGVDLPSTDVKFSEKTNSFCIVGLVCVRKNTLQAIKYFADNYADVHDAVLYICGPIDNVDSNEFSYDYVDKCKRLVSELNIVSQVIFTGNLDGDQLNAIYRSAKALIFFSSSEGLPNAVLEAMSFNCVPIMQELNGLSNEILSDRGGFIIERLSDRISIEDIDNKICQSMPYHVAMKYFSISSAAKSIGELYHK